LSTTKINGLMLFKGNLRLFWKP